MGAAIANLEINIILPAGVNTSWQVKPILIRCVSSQQTDTKTYTHTEERERERWKRERKRETESERRHGPTCMMLASKVSGQTNTC